MRLLHSLVEGGQTWAHRIRMVKQVIKMTLSLSILSASVYLVSILALQDPILFQSGYYRLKAELGPYISPGGISVSPRFWEKVSHEKIKNEKILPATTLKKMTQKKTQTLIDLGKKSLFQALLFAGATFLCILVFFLARGIFSKRKRHIAGKKRVFPITLRLQLLLSNKASDLKIGPIPLVKGTETQHLLVTGGTGSGKTNCFHHILPQVRHKGQKAIIIDTTGAFVKKYYDPTKDVLLNPFDERGVAWHPWAECENAFDYDNFAESIIPPTHHDQENYWRTAARALLSAVMQKLRNTQKTSELAHWLHFVPLDQLAEFVQDTKAAAHLDINSEKTAASIRSVAASFLGSLEYLQDTNTPFSIKNWVQNSSQEGWLFLYSNPSQRSALNSLLSCWFSTGIRSLLQMTPDQNRRVWFVVDELPTLQKLKELDSLVTESRKYGGCGLLAMQSPSQLEEIYGRASAHTLMGNCATRIIFAEHDPEIAERISKSLGEREIKEYQEGISYGAHEVRDGVSLSLQTKKTPVVSTTDIQSLENNRAYIKLPGNLPVSKIYLKLQ